MNSIRNSTQTWVGFAKYKFNPKRDVSGNLMNVQYVIIIYRVRLEIKGNSQLDKNVEHCTISIVCSASVITANDYEDDFDSKYYYTKQTERWQNICLRSLCRLLANERVYRISLLTNVITLLCPPTVNYINQNTHHCVLSKSRRTKKKLHLPDDLFEVLAPIDFNSILVIHIFLKQINLYRQI